MKIAIFSRRETTVIETLRLQRSWDPDIKALLAVIDEAQARFDAKVDSLDILIEAGNILSRYKVSAVHFDIFDSGKVGMARRTGVFGAGPDMRQALRALQATEPRPLHWDEFYYSKEMGFEDDDPESSVKK